MSIPILPATCMYVHPVLIKGGKTQLFPANAPGSLVLMQKNMIYANKSMVLFQQSTPPLGDIGPFALDLNLHAVKMTKTIFCRT